MPKGLLGEPRVGPPMQIPMPSAPLSPGLCRCRFRSRSTRSLRSHRPSLRPCSRHLRRCVERMWSSRHSKERPPCSRQWSPAASPPVACRLARFSRPRRQLPEFPEASSPAPPRASLGVDPASADRYATSAPPPLSPGPDCPRRSQQTSASVG